MNTPHPEPGKRFGPYDVLATLGSGGMGIVFRGRDARLNREVALKVLSPDSRHDPARLQRFEQEVRAAAALSHPNVVAVFDVGREGDTPYFVTELLHGVTLRARLREGPLAPARVIDLGLQVARGLTAIHAHGLVHRDLKPENLFLTTEGQVKILDFGVARTVEEVPSSATLPLTASGAVLGTAGYMAPEQVRGQVADARSDLFAVGVILHECLSGRPTFAGNSPVERAYAILNSAPAPLEGVPSGLARVVSWCLQKDPQSRPQHARDLLYILEVVRDAPGAVPPSPTRGRSSLTRGRLAVGALVLLGSGAGVTQLVRGPVAPRAALAAEVKVRQVSFRNGMVEDARFASDGRTLAYTARFDEQPSRVFQGVVDGVQHRPVSPPGTTLRDLSPTDELALGEGPVEVGSPGCNELSRAAFAGSAPRVFDERVCDASWGPDGGLLITRWLAGEVAVEYPPGREVLRGEGLLRARLSPDGSRLAVVRRVDDVDARVVELYDRSGALLAWSPPALTLEGLSWTPSGDEVWFAASFTGRRRDLFGLSVDGRRRTVFATASGLTLHDVDARRRVLVTAGVDRRQLWGRVGDEARLRSLSWLPDAVPVALSSDGRVLLLSLGPLPAETQPQLWLRRFEGADDAPVHLGHGLALALSADGRWVLSADAADGPVRLVPTGAGDTRVLPRAEGVRLFAGAFFADGSRVALGARGEGGRPEALVQSLDGGAAQRVSAAPFRLTAPPSPDGRWLAGVDLHADPALLELDGGALRTLPGLKRGDRPLQWTSDGLGLWISRAAAPGAREVLRYELADGGVGLHLRLQCTEQMGRATVGHPALTPDGAHHAYDVLHQVNQLFLVDGLR